MCGLVGVLAFRDARLPVSSTLIDAMRDTMVHRGPDGSGTWVRDDGRVGLGHRRLSIIDLSSAAAQPMSNEDGRVRVVFNGEIYNHAEIRAELKRIGGHTWVTDHSDTEVIVHAFEQWGIDCLERFRGMFAIAIWDDAKRELWLVRDRLGIKPLYYSIHHSRIAFASEIKALLKDPQQPRRINEESFFHYLSFLTTPAPATMFAGIRKLAAGTWLRVSEDGACEERRYWDVWDHTSPLVGVPEKEIARTLLAELETAVTLRKVGDVPVGVFLSGGIDSSTNAALFAAGQAEPVKTFSVGYGKDYGSYRNELSYARRMAEAVSADHHECLLQMEDLLGFLPEMVRLQDEPLADPVCVPLYFLSRLAREQGVKVCQVGEGADELFCGYPAWRTLLTLQKYNDLGVPSFAKRMGLFALRALGQGDTARYEWLRRGALGQPIFWGGAEAFTHEQKQAMLSPRLRKEFKGLSSWSALLPIRQRFEAKAWEPTPLNWMSYLDLNLRLPELLLMRVDKMSMGVGLEAREPFLDHKLVEFAMSIPSAVKTRGGELKHVLKTAVRGLIPDEIIDRPKQGFGVPVYEWFFDKLGDSARTTVSEFVERTDLLDHRYVMRLLDGRRVQEAWTLLNLALWWNEYVAD